MVGQGLPEPSFAAAEADPGGRVGDLDQGLLAVITEAVGHPGATPFLVPGATVSVLALVTSVGQVLDNIPERGAPPPAGVALVGGRAGRRAAAAGLVALAVDSAVVNIGLKVAARRRRPDRDSAGVPAVRMVPMPQSASFPSGHTASGFAIMNAVAHTLPAAAGPLGLLASAVGYSRIHTGVHYPGDVVIGAVIGTAVGEAVR